MRAGTTERYQAVATDRRGGPNPKAVIQADLREHDGWLLASLEAGQAAWPGVQITADQLRAHVVGREPPSEAHGGDLYLACALARGSVSALATFERRIVPTIERLVRARCGDADRVTAAIKSTRERLLVALPGRPAGIAAYSGRGPLVAWLVIIATRELLRSARPSLVPEPGAGGDAALGRLRDRHGEALDLVFRECVSALPIRDRKLLHQELMAGMSPVRIAEEHAIACTTAIRWLTEARHGLSTSIRDAVRRHLGTESLETQRIMQVVNRQLSQTVGPYLVPAGSSAQV